MSESAGTDAAPGRVPRALTWKIRRTPARLAAAMPSSISSNVSRIFEKNKLFPPLVCMSEAWTAMIGIEWLRS